MRRHELNEAAWRRLAPLPPPERPRRGGRPPLGRRRTVNGVLRISRTGPPRRDLPGRYGPWSSVANAFYRRRAAGVWDRALAGLQREADARGRPDRPLHAVDSTAVRAHQHAAGARRAGAIGG